MPLLASHGIHHKIASGMRIPKDCFRAEADPKEVPGKLRVIRSGGSQELLGFDLVENVAKAKGTKPAGYGPRKGCYMSPKARPIPIIKQDSSNNFSISFPPDGGSACRVPVSASLGENKIGRFLLVLTKHLGRST